MTMEEARQQVKEFIRQYGLDVIIDYLLELPAERQRAESVQLAILALKTGELADMQQQVEISSNSRLSNFQDQP